MSRGRVAAATGAVLIAVLAALIARGTQAEAVRLAALSEVLVPEERDRQRDAVLERLSLPRLRSAGALSPAVDVTVTKPTDRSYLSVNVLADSEAEAEAAAIVVSSELVRLGEAVGTDLQADRLTEATTRLLAVVAELDAAQAEVDAAIRAEALATAQVLLTAPDQRESVDAAIDVESARIAAARDERNALFEERLALDAEVRTIRLALDSTPPSLEVVDPLFEPPNTNQRAVTFLVGGLVLMGLVGMAITPQPNRAEVRVA